MRQKSLSTLAVAAFIACSVLGPPAEVGAKENSDGFSEETKQLLKENRLKKVAKKDPAEAIRTLDGLRAGDESGIVSTAITEVALDAADRSTPYQAKGFYMRALAETHAAALEQALGGGGEALTLQKEALEGLVRVLQATDSEALRGEVDVIDGPLSRYELIWVEAGEMWTAATHEFEFASDLPQPKANRATGVDALGIPLVAVRKDQPEETAEDLGGVFEVYEDYYALTAIFELGVDDGPSPRQAAVRLLEPFVDDGVTIDGTVYPISIDLGAALATARRETDAIFAKKGMLYASKYLSLTGLYLMQPPRPGKIPLVMLHGLGSSPMTWTTAARAFLTDPTIREAYQIWLWAYPTGLPFPFSAMLLRRSLNEAVDHLEAEGSDPNNDRVVMMAHSMGGLLTRMQVTDTGTALWDAVFTVPPEELDMNPDDVALLEEVMLVEPLPFIERAIFCSTPHRGSKYAANTFGKIGAALVKLPVELAARAARFLSGNPYLTEEAKAFGEMADSIETLDPEHPLIETLDTLPVDPSVIYHTVVGDRGKGAGPGSSDGVVDYWSAHLDGAASEKSVPSGHGSHKHEDGVEELVRILYLHLEEGRGAEAGARDTGAGVDP